MQTNSLNLATTPGGFSQFGAVSLFTSAAQLRAVCLVRFQQVYLAKCRFHGLTVYFVLKLLAKKINNALTTLEERLILNAALIFKLNLLLDFALAVF